MAEGQGEVDDPWFADVNSDHGLDQQSVLSNTDKPHILNPEHWKRMVAFESMDYEEPQNQLYKNGLARKLSGRSHYVKWSIMVLIGLCVGVWACLVVQTMYFTCDSKIKWAESVVDHFKGNGTSTTIGRLGISSKAFGFGFMFLMFWTATGAILAPAFCVLVPTAAGSGVPDVTGYLNGVKMPNIFNFGNLLVKSTSCISAVQSGLPSGCEGPLIHMGSLIGAGVARPRQWIRSLLPSLHILDVLKNPKDHRDFVTAGAACGVTAAFNAPIGGLLYVMEEMATYFPSELGYQVFVSCLSCMLMIQLINTFVYGWRPTGEGRHGDFTQTSILMFHVNVANTTRVEENWSMLPTTVGLSAAMGLLSAVFTTLNLRYMRFRGKHMFPKPWLKVLEPLLVAVPIAAVGLMLCLAFPCEEVPPFALENMKALNIQLFTAFCANPATQHHPLGSLVGTNSYNAIRLLFSRNTDGLFPWHALLIYMILYLVASCLCIGMFISSGVVIPALVIGGTAGRMLGVVVGPQWADAGVLSLIGASAFFGGIMRLTFALTVVMVEVTGDVYHIGCIMIAILIGKTLTDRFVHNFNVSVLEMKCIPFLEKHSLHELDVFCAKHFMSPEPVCVPLHCTVDQLTQVLSEGKHNGFPVVIGDLRKSAYCSCEPCEKLLDSGPSTFVGMLQRKTIESCLRKVADGSAVGGNTIRCDDSLSPRNNEVPTIDDSMRATVVCLRDLVDVSPPFVLATTSVSRSYELFLQMSLRHLPVVDHRHRVVGIVTRKEFVGHQLHKRLKEQIPGTP